MKYILTIFSCLLFLQFLGQDIDDSLAVQIQKTKDNYSLEKKKFNQEEWSKLRKKLDYSDIKEKKEPERKAQNKI